MQQLRATKQTSGECSREWPPIVRGVCQNRWIGRPRNRTRGRRRASPGWETGPGRSGPMSAPGCRTSAWRHCRPAVMMRVHMAAWGAGGGQRPDPFLGNGPLQSNHLLPYVSQCECGTKMCGSTHRLRGTLGILAVVIWMGSHVKEAGAQEGKSATVSLRGCTRHSRLCLIQWGDKQSHVPEHNTTFVQPTANKPYPIHSH